MKVFSINRYNSDKVEILEFDNALVNFFSKQSVFLEHTNQDGLVLVSDSEGLRVAAVIDGMGGHQGGEEATQLVIDNFNKTFEKMKTKADLRGEIIDTLENADEDIKKLKIGAGATISAVEFGEGFLRFYNAGDAFGLMLGARGKFKFKTIEHSPLGFGIEAGIIERDKAHGIEDNIVSNGLGFMPMRIEMGQKIGLGSNDIILLGSDGILNTETIESLSATITEGDFNQRLTQIFDDVLSDPDRKLLDDTTLILVRFSGNTSPS